MHKRKREIQFIDLTVINKIASFLNFHDRLQLRICSKFIYNTVTFDDVYIAYAHNILKYRVNLRINTFKYVFQSNQKFNFLKGITSLEIVRPCVNSTGIDLELLTTLICPHNVINGLNSMFLKHLKCITVVNSNLINLEVLQIEMYSNCSKFKNVQKFICDDNLTYSSGMFPPNCLKIYVKNGVVTGVPYSAKSLCCYNSMLTKNKNLGVLHLIKYSRIPAGISKLSIQESVKIIKIPNTVTYLAIVKCENLIIPNTIKFLLIHTLSTFIINGILDEIIIDYNEPFNANFLIKKISCITTGDINMSCAKILKTKKILNPQDLPITLDTLYYYSHDPIDLSNTFISTLYIYNKNIITGWPASDCDINFI